MAVIVANSRWQSHVPYVIDPLARRLASGCIAEINAAAGKILVPKKGNDRAFLDISKGYAQSESIGYKGGPIQVSAESRRALIHEILHALGFCHEQFHSDFAWSVPQPDVRRAKENPKRYFATTARANPWNKYLIDLIERGLKAPKKMPALKKRAGTGGTAKPRMDERQRQLQARRAGHKRRQDDPEFRKFLETKGKAIGRSLLESPDPGPEQQFMSYVECLSNPNIIMSDVCDYDSIMMYDNMAQAAYDTQENSRLSPAGQMVKERDTELRSMGNDRGLSPRDAEALRRYIAPGILGTLRERLRHKRFGERLRHKTITVGSDKNGKF